MISKLVSVIVNIGVVQGMTFRAVFQEGVGMVIEPNPNPTAMQPNAVAVTPPAGRRHKRRASGAWSAKPVRYTWK